MLNAICLKGARDICHAVGENPKHMARLVREFGLPAWKRDPKGTWRALPEDLALWVRRQRNHHLSDYVPDMVARS
ncbi:DNA-binding protein [Pseudodesulfovibrio tunisiensis]|uniref:DNA-binding protein n=1 Tax=Pseudodesulfovibrio tunisiensis TaxID=463192 RepID=UPI001FB2BDA0|nr:DNA-binding protein [Pseudodesulfovibrio tunisiensis]